MTRVGKVPGSNLSRDTDCPDCGFLSFLQSRGECLDSILNLVTAASLDALFRHSLVNLQFDAVGL
jgi:hypothetical protein